MTLPTRQPTSPPALEPTAPTVGCPDEIVCHCLQVTASAIDVAITVDGCRSVREVVGSTEAGAGCTACHRRIRELLIRRVDR